MKILLLQDVKKLGRKFDVKEVSEGYARNFLIARKLAVPADKTALRAKKESDETEAGLIKKHQEAARVLGKTTMEFFVKVGKNNEVFGSVKPEEIKSVLLKKELIQANAEIILSKPLRYLGEHSVEVDFGRGIRGTTKIILSPRQ